MKLTDEKIEEIWERHPAVFGHVDISYYFTPEDAISFARAILKEAGMEELEQKLAGYDRWLSKGVYFTDEEYAAECLEVRELKAALSIATQRAQELERAAKRYRWLQENPKEGVCVLLAGSDPVDTDAYLDHEVQCAELAKSKQ